MTIKNQEALEDRAEKLGAFNGFKMAVVTLQPDPNPTQAVLTVHFHNNNEVANIFSEFTDPVNPTPANVFFPITGGHRIPAGPLDGQVQVVDIAEDPADGTVLHLTVAPIGDYSTYTLAVVFQNIDPLFGEIDFKFRPGCFNNCPPDWETSAEPQQDPAIDYLAKDFDSFRHTMIAWMIDRVPGWQPTSEADLDQVLLELFSAAADELSDYQDRVMNEAYLANARKRVSLARHARLMDYHIHQGNQASTWLALEVKPGQHTIDKDLIVWAGDKFEDPAAVVFMSRRIQPGNPHLVKPLVVNALLNNIGLYTWSDAIPALAAGSTSADLKLLADGQIAAEDVQDLIRNRTITHLLIQEHLNPVTGETRGRDPTKRQVLKLLADGQGAEAIQDPVTDEWFVRVRWEEKDQLKNKYCFTVDCPEPKGKVENVSLFHGNLVHVYHGRPRKIVFLDPAQFLSDPDEFHYQRSTEGVAIGRLPDGPLAYKDTLPGGELPSASTLEVEVEINGTLDPWEEIISLIHSDDSSEGGNHFVVETDEAGRSLIRFGNGINGRKLPVSARVHCAYQIGQSLDGNIGADMLQSFDENEFSDIISCWNPFDVINGRAPEPVGEIMRRVPEAYRHHQLRAVTLADYVARAEELADVSRASARYMWTGSWRTVRVAIDPVGTTTLTPELRAAIARHLDAVRLIGEDLEIRPPRLVPLDIAVFLCIHPNYWPEDIIFILEQEFSDGFTPDGRLAFFHPDRWTLGQELRASQIIGQVQAVKGVDHVIEIVLQRFNEVTPGLSDVITVQANEIIQVKNDPDHMELGFLKFDVKGGRQ